MAHHDAEHALRVREALADPGGPARSALADCADCLRELDELRSLGLELDGAAALEREVLAEAGALGLGDGEALPVALGARGQAVRGRQAAAGEPGGDPRRWRSRRVGWSVALVAAAALALFVVRVASSPRRGEPSGPPLAAGAPDLVLDTDQASPSGLRPRGAVPSFDRPFRWDLAGDGWFLLRVYSDEDGALPDDPPLVTSPRVHGSSWSWPAAVTRGWPRRIRWEVQAFDATGLPIGAAEARAVRAPDTDGQGRGG